MEEFIDNITEADMPNEDMRLVYRECGCETALHLLEHFDGMKIYIPSNGFRNIKKRLVIKHADKMTPAELAMRFKVPLDSVYKIIRARGRDEKQTTFLEGEKNGDC